MDEDIFISKWKLIFIFNIVVYRHLCYGFPLSVTNGSTMTNEMLEGYVQMFFMPVETATLSEEADLNFHMNFPHLREDTSNQIFHSVQSYNFLSMPLTLSTIDPDLLTLETSQTSLMGEMSPNPGLLKMTMEKIFDKPRNRNSHPSNREFVGGYIYEKMGRSGLIVTMQDFEHELPLKEYAKIYYDETLAPVVEVGTNIIGILPGRYWETERDRPLIIGAHWDSVTNTTGFDDNGSGVAVMLDVARALGTSKKSVGKSCFVPDYTVLFVAFDSEEPGSFGSLQFLRKFLVPRFLRKGIEIQGAIILDTIMNVDLNVNSQDVPKEWFTLVPEAAKKIKTNDFRGNFMAVVGRGHPQERILSQSLSKWWKYSEDGKESNMYPIDFELKKLPFDRDPQTSELLDHSYFWLSDHSRFWYYRENSENFVFMPALLLTDTAFHRGYMRECYHKGCDVNSEELVTPVNYQFLERTAQSLIGTISELAMEDKSSINDCILPKASQPETTTTTSTPLTTTTSATTITTSPTTTTEQPSTSATIEVVQTPLSIENVDVDSGMYDDLIGNEIDGVKQKTRPKKDNPLGFNNKEDSNEHMEDEEDELLEMFSKSGCKENHCHQEDSDSSDENELSGQDFKQDVIGSLAHRQAAMLSLVDRMNFVRGPQINIENFHFDMSNQYLFQKGGEKKSKSKNRKNGPDILLGSGSVDPTILASVIQSFYGGSNSIEEPEEENRDRRKYKGKHQTNSPMYIRVKNKK